MPSTPAAVSLCPNLDLDAASLRALVRLETCTHNRAANTVANACPFDNRAQLGLVSGCGLQVCEGGLARMPLLAGAILIS